MFWWTCLPEHHSQHPKNLKWANRARFKAAQIAFMCSTLITTVLKRCGVSQPRIHTCIWLERDSAHQTLNHDSHIFAISLRHMGATVLSKDEKEQRIYIVLLIEVPLYGKSIFSVFLLTRTNRKSMCGHTHTCSDGHSQSIRHALSPQCWRCLSGRAPGCLVHRKGSLKWMYFYLLQDNVG